MYISKLPQDMTLNADAWGHLEAFILSRAPKHHLSDRAPGTWEDLLAWSQDNIIGVHSLPISREGNEGTIWSQPRVNVAFRAWHDAVHLAQQAQFDYDSEERVAAVQCHDALQNLGIYGTWAAKVIAIETWGQAMYHAEHGTFVTDQRAFFKMAWRAGMAAAIQHKQQNRGI